MHTLSVLAAEGIHNRDLWYPTILGVLVVIAAVGLFVRHAHPAARHQHGRPPRVPRRRRPASSGLMVLVSLLWLTNPSPVNTLKGRIPAWVAVESIENGDIAKSNDRRGARHRQQRPRGERGRRHQPQGRGRQQPDPHQERADRRDPLRRRGQVRDLHRRPPTTSCTKNQVTGGGGLFSGTSVDFGGGWPWVHVSLHKPQYAVVTTCKVDPRRRPTEVPFGAKPPVPEVRRRRAASCSCCERDLGSLRVPPFVAFLAFSLLFGLTLLGLHWRERDLQEQAARVTDEADAITKAARRVHPRDGLRSPVMRRNLSIDGCVPRTGVLAGTGDAARRRLQRRSARRRRRRARPGRPRVRAPRRVLRPLPRRALLHGPRAPAAACARTRSRQHSRHGSDGAAPPRAAPLRVRAQSVRRRPRRRARRCGRSRRRRARATRTSSRSRSARGTRRGRACRGRTVA